MKRRPSEAGPSARRLERELICDVRAEMGIAFDIAAAREENVVVLVDVVNAPKVKSSVRVSPFLVRGLMKNLAAAARQLLPERGWRPSSSAAVRPEPNGHWCASRLWRVCFPRLGNRFEFIFLTPHEDIGP